MVRHGLSWLTTLTLVGVACGDDGGGPSGDDSTGADAGTTATSTSGATSASSTTADSAGSTSEAGDVEPPELVDVRVTIDGGTLVDLNNGDLQRVLPDPAVAEFTVRARDDVTDDENLVLMVVDDATGEALPDTTAEFANGLWRVTTAVEAGHVYRARATDEAGNVGDGAFGLVTPTLAEAIVAPWDAYEYDSENVSEVYELVLSDDGTWVESERVGTLVRTGTWNVEGDQLSLIETTRSDGDGNPSTEDFAQVSPFYVDEDYLSLRPYLGADGQVDDAGGSWARTWVEQEPGGGGQLQDVRTVQETLTLSDDGDYTLERVTTPAGQAAETASEAGTWRIELNGEYFANYGDFLVLTTDEVDGQPVTPAEGWSLHRARAGRLLVRPYVPSEG